METLCKEYLDWISSDLINLIEQVKENTVEDDNIYLTSNEQIALILDNQTFDERVEFANWLSSIEDTSIEGFAFALSNFSFDYDYDEAIEAQLNNG